MLMKKLFSLLLLVLVFAAPPLAEQNVQAAAATDQIVLTFKELGVSSILMQGPFSSERLRFSLPANWALQDGAEITLIASTYFAGESAPGGTSSEYIGAVLQVSFNGQLIASQPLRLGEDVVYRLKIPAEALNSTRSDGRHEISLFLDAGIDCDYEFHRTLVEISGASSVTLPYAETAIPMDLRRLPRPIFQPDLVVPRSAVLVMPDVASADEVQAALNVMAAFGRMSARQLDLTAMTLSELTENLRRETDLIFVGKAASLSILAQQSLPAPLNGARFEFAGLQDTDGLLQLAASPWNAGRTMLVVGGNSDEGVVKAAQALTTGNLITSTRPDVSVVQSVNPAMPAGIQAANSAQLTSADVTLADLGFGTQTVAFNSTAGTGSLYITFTIPAGLVPTEGAYMDLIFSNSELIDYARSGIAVYLNNTLVGSARLSDETSTGGIQRISFPASTFRLGENLITIDAGLIPLDNCTSPGFENLWVTVFSDTKLHLPLTEAAVKAASRLRNLSDYPAPFTDDPTLGTTLFVIPEKDPQAWKSAGALAYDLGSRAPGVLLNLDVTFDNIPEQMQVTHNLIVVGQPAQLPVLSDLANSLPASFEAGSNAALLDNQHVIYRISADKSLGYLELLTSPWNDQRTVMAVLGTTPDGVASAGNALVVSAIRNTLKGNFAVIDGTASLIADTRIGTGAGALAAGLGPNMTVQPTLSPVSPVQAEPVQVKTGKDVIPPALAVVTVLIIIVIVLAVWLKRRSQKSA